MPTYLSPGVYVEEVSSGPKAIGMVGTSTAAFLGLAPKQDAHVDEAVPCSNWGQFCREFLDEDSIPTDLARAVFGYFSNGGRRCYIVNIGRSGSIAGEARKRSGVSVLEGIDEVTIVAAPGFADAITYDALLTHCENLQDRVAILDPPREVQNLDDLTKMATLPVTSASKKEEEGGEAKKSDTPTGCRPRTSEGGYGAFYFPWLNCRDPFGPDIVAVPPSGAMAGIYARTDALRGVHKAPANEVVRGCCGLTYRVTRIEQGELNRQGVNVIRMFPDGIRVWGARTLAKEASEWRYIPVRRTVNMIKESIKQGTSWTVFEPNDVMTYKAVERDIRAFLTLVWRGGALRGTTPEEAFFVKCDEETNPPDVRDAGQLIAEIGIAPVKPAEFIIFRISQWAGNEGEPA